jgi:hypothetical protein
MKSTTTTYPAGERISQMRKRIRVTAAPNAFEHTGYPMRVHEILGFFSITFGQRGYHNGHVLPRSHNIWKVWRTAVKTPAETALARVRLHNSVRC